MVRIILSGQASDPIFAQAEMLGYYLERNLPDFSISVSFKNAEQWKEFVDLHYEKHGWNTRLARDRTIKSPDSLQQLFWYESGELIGNAEDFFKFTKATYNYNQDAPSADPALLESIAIENIAQGVHQTLRL